MKHKREPEVKDDAHVGSKKPKVAALGKDVQNNDERRDFLNDNPMQFLAKGFSDISTFVEKLEAEDAKLSSFTLDVMNHLQSIMGKYEECRLNMATAAESDDFKPTMALFAKSGLGKSFILNLFLRMTCIDFNFYRQSAQTAIRNDKDGKYMEARKQFGDFDREEMLSDVSVIPTTSSSEETSSQDDTVDMLKRYCEEGDKLDTESPNFVSFLLPSTTQNFGSTTGAPIHLSFGNVLQLVVTKYGIL